PEDFSFPNVPGIFEIGCLDYVLMIGEKLLTKGSTRHEEASSTRHEEANGFSDTWDFSVSYKPEDFSFPKVPGIFEIGCLDYVLMIGEKLLTKDGFSDTWDFSVSYKPEDFSFPNVPGIFEIGCLDYVLMIGEKLLTKGSTRHEEANGFSDTWDFSVSYKVAHATKKQPEDFSFPKPEDFSFPNVPGIFEIGCLDYVLMIGEKLLTKAIMFLHLKIANHTRAKPEDFSFPKVPGIFEIGCLDYVLMIGEKLLTKGKNFPAQEILYEQPTGFRGRKMKKMKNRECLNQGSIQSRPETSTSGLVPLDILDFSVCYKVGHATKRQVAHATKKQPEDFSFPNVPGIFEIGCLDYVLMIGEKLLTKGSTRHEEAREKLLTKGKNFPAQEILYEQPTGFIGHPFPLFPNIQYTTWGDLACWGSTRHVEANGFSDTWDFSVSYKPEDFSFPKPEDFSFPKPEDFSFPKPEDFSFPNVLGIFEIGCLDYVLMIGEKLLTKGSTRHEEASELKNQFQGPCSSFSTNIADGFSDTWDFSVSYKPEDFSFPNVLGIFEIGCLDYVLMIGEKLLTKGSTRHEEANGFSDTWDFSVSYKPEDFSFPKVPGIFEIGCLDYVLMIGEKLLTKGSTRHEEATIMFLHLKIANHTRAKVYLHTS
ncbi:predicted protein, partial [Nematostella vectensis]